jgi:hypothetical protein
MNEENKNLKKCTVCNKDIAKNANSCPHCGAKIKKPFYKRGWFIIVALIIVIAAIASNGSNNENTTSNNTVQTNGTVSTETSATKAPIEYTVYTVSELVKDLEANALNAENKYNNKYVEITGKLSVIDSKGKYISLSPSDELISFVSVQCYIKNDEQKSKVATLSTGDTVTLKGKITSIGEVLGYSLDIDSIN